MLTLNKSHAGSSLLSFGTNEQKCSPEKCRICLDDGEMPIFGTNDISDDVTAFGNIKIDKDDNLPQYVCESCYTLLEAAILFRKTAQQSDEVLKRMVHSDSGSEDSDRKQEDETYIKTEYLEFYYSSDSESKLDDFDRLKRECKSEDETVNNYNLSSSDADTQDSYNSSTHFQPELLHVKRDDDGTINEADSETIMIIVSDKEKEKIKQEQNADENSKMDFNNDDEEMGERNDKSPKKTLPHQQECEVCHDIVSKNAYRVHLKEHREKYKEKFNKKYGKVKCEICGKKISKSYLKYHMKLHGTAEEQAERLIKCTICNKMFNINYYSDHLKRVHQKKSLKSKEKIQNVKTKKTPPKFNKCPVCDKKVPESEFKLHLEKHGGPLKRYICDKCGKVFKHPSTFKTHYLTHGSELKYKCQFCPYRGLHQGLLKIHVRTHTGDYHYKCTECPAQFITKSNLSKHLQRHKGLFTFKCEFCGKGYYSKSDLEKHYHNSHTSAKNHVCEVCGKAFGHRDNMLSHQLKVHKRDKIVTRGRMPSYLKADLMHLE